MVGNAFSPLPLGEVPQFANWGGEGLVEKTRGIIPSQSKTDSYEPVFDSSPKGGAKAYVADHFPQIPICCTIK